MSSERVEELKITIPTLTWIIIVTIALTVMGNVFVYFLPFPFTCNMNAGDLIATPGVDLLGIPFTVTLIIGALMYIPSARKYLTTTSLMLLYIVALASSAFANQDSPWREAFEPILGRVGTPEDAIRYVPEFVSPPREAAEALIRGTGSITAIPWGQLLPAIIWRFFTFAFFAGVSVGLISIFRRQWIDVERLAYPQVAIAYNAIIGVGEVRNPKWIGRSVFILGFLIGFGLELIRACIAFFPWFPDVYSWRTATCGPGTHHLLIPGTTWHYGLNKHTPFYALLLLAPLHSLFSVVFWGIIYEVASAAAVTLGYYSGYVDMGHCGKSWCGQNTPYAEPPLAFGSLVVGVTLGVFVMTIFHERQHIIMTLKMAFGGGRGERIEAEEPMSYRVAWMIFIGSFIVGIIVFMVAGMSLWASFIVILTGVVTWFTMSQLWGRIGFSNEPGYNFGPGFAKIFLWPTEYALPVTNTDRILAHTYVYELASHRPSVPWCTTFYTVLGSYKMASLMKVHPRNVVKIASISLIVAMLVACIMNVILPGVYGMGRTTCYTTNNLMGRVNHMWAVPSPRPMVDIAPWVAGGFVFMVVMSLLHVRFLWMPDPVMSIIAWDWIGGLHGTWMASLIVCIVKWLILRIGGSKFYEERAVPFAGGFILGAALNALIAGIGAFVTYRPI
ncbi:hypothetical protein KEJ27_08120 [Candidatus Bathyarchaeota archaeon]|nr:hypothetical protein [Candidatus Bathyarchaeota archaeon]MBS7618456.1 hypothetical protein [Candidatus Bathyarchaeota archaeon]